MNDVTDVKTWVQFQEVTEPIYGDAEVLEELRLATVAQALLEIHKQGYEELEEPELSVGPMARPYIDPVTGETIVALIRAKVRCAIPHD